MPLITHSPEFLAKQAAKRAKEKARERAINESKEKATRVKEFLAEQEILSEIDSLRSKGINNLSPAERQQLKDYYVAAAVQNVYLIRWMPVRYYQTLKEMMRKIRLNKQLSREIFKKDISDPEFFKETSEIMEILSHNIEHLGAFIELGVEGYKEKYNLNRKRRNGKISKGNEIRPLERAISEFQESPDEFEIRTREYIRSLNLKTSQKEESE